MGFEDDLREHQEHEGNGECPHESGERYQAYDADGCGYYVWKCDGCGAEFVDDLS